MGRRHARFLRAVARRAADQALRDRARSARLGQARFLGEGLDYVAYLMDAELPGADGSEGVLQLVARVARRGMSAAEKERARREVRLLERLGREALPFRLPAVLSLEEVEGRLVMVQTACHGIPLRPRGDAGAHPWEVIAEVAASLHGLDIEGWSQDVIGPGRGRREHVLARRADVAEEAPAEFDAALGFVEEHLPAERPGVLLHGDLLPQNIRVDAPEGDPPAVLDWTYATYGDPAHDLAVVTRGVRRPFGVDEGRKLLLEAYNASSAEPITLVDLSVHELLLRMGLHAQLAADRASEAEREQAVRFVEGLLRRAREHTY